MIFHVPRLIFKQNSTPLLIPLESCTEAISRARTQYSQQRRSTGENLSLRTLSLVTSDQRSAEFAKNIGNIEENLIKMKEIKMQKLTSLNLDLEM